MIEVLVINLDADAVRFHAIEGQFAGLDGFSVSRVRGVTGGALPELACAMLTGRKNYKANVGAGTLGVFLAHVAAWERAAASDCEMSFVMEDDIRLRNLRLLTEAAIPADADVVFCNNRMEPLPDPARDTSHLNMLDIELGLRRLAHVKSRAVGADGYLLRRSAARKLLAAVEQDLMFGHVDWRVLRYCVTDAQIAQAIPGSDVETILHRRSAGLKTPPGLLKGYVASPALVIVTGTPSRRMAENTSAA